MAQALTIEASATATGAQPAAAAAGGAPFSTYGLQVKGVGGTPTSWSVTLDGSLDGANWTTLITHNATDGSTSWETTGKPVLFIRVNVAAVTLGPASALKLTAVAVP